ncbi:MAG: response regulator [Desulfarculaceae bacterium]|jgi:FixJ family two-component response regulator/anti-sigma regulatory factor (Ser/Thr protein kinase)
MTACPSTNEIQSSSAPAGVRILVADEDASVRDLLSRFLQKIGYTVAEAQNGREAVELFQGYTFSLVLCDLNISGFSGLKLLKTIKALNPRVPVVIMGGFGELPVVVDALKSGAENFLPKPLNLTRLPKLIEQSLSLSNLPVQQAPFLPEVRQISYIKVPSQVDTVPQVIQHISFSAVTAAFAVQDLNNNLKLALVEGITNAMEHGNNWNSAKKVIIHSEVTSRILNVSIKDEGNGFDPQELPDPTDGANLLCERGRGVFLMQAIMDEVTFVPPGNEVILRKHKI